jgi:abhydrolase domain-containing protein 6
MMSTFIDLVHQQVRRQFHRAGFASGLFECKRFTLHYYERPLPGSPTTLVLLHGLGTSSSTWTRVLPGLAGVCNILALDLPGFGLSRVNNGPGFAVFEELSEAVAAFIRQRTTRPIFLLGHSLGGWLAAKFAADHPESVKHLLLVNNAGILCEDTVGQRTAFQVESVGDMRRLLDLIWFRYPWYFKPFYRAVFSDLRRRSVAEFVGSIRSEDFLNDDLRKLTMDVSIIWGEQDKLISMKSVDIMKRSIPRACVYLLNQCGHVPQLERPDKFVDVIREILRREISIENNSRSVTALKKA